MDKLRFFARRRDLGFAVGYLLLAVLAANCLGWYGPNLGLGLSMAALTLLTAAYLWPARRRIGLYGVFCLVGAVACGMSLFWSGDSAVKRVTVLLALVLATCSVIDMQGLWRHRKGSFRSLADVIRWGLTYPLCHCGDAVFALFHRLEPDGGVKKRRTGSVLLGLLCALPLLLVLVPLLMRSDAAFAGLLDRVDLDTVVELLFSLGLGLGLFLVLFTQGFLLPRYQASPLPEKPPRRGIEPVALGTFLGVICGVYVLYLLSQLAYFFSGFAGILPPGYTAAEYARRGFFEMCVVCAINLLLIFLCVLLVRKRQGREPLGIRLMALFIGLFSLVLIVTALSKMGLYVSLYGLTRLRVVTSVFMVWLAVCFGCVILRLFIRGFGYMKPALAAAAILLLGLSFANCDRVIATYNYQAWQQGELEQLDVEHLGQLSDAAVPVLWQIAQTQEQTYATCARAWLADRGTELLELDWGQDADLTAARPAASLPPLEPRAYNRDIRQAQRLLAEHWEQIWFPDYWNYMGY